MTSKPNSSGPKSLNFNKKPIISHETNQKFPSSQSPSIGAQKDSVKYIKAMVLYDYIAKDDSKLNLKKDETIWIVTKHESGWYNGYYVDPKNGSTKFGWFPGSYVKEIGPVAGDSVQKSSLLTKTSLTSVKVPGQSLSQSNNALKQKVPESMESGEFSNKRLNKINSNNSLKSNLENTKIDNDRDSDEDDLNFLTMTLETTKLMAEENKPSTMYRRGSITTYNSIETLNIHEPQVKLPPNWGIKYTKDGRKYFYNYVNNKTTWDINSPVEQEKIPVIPGVLPELPSIEDLECDFDFADLTWDLYTRKILKSIAAIVGAAKANAKTMFSAYCKMLMKLVKHLLISSNCVDKTSAYLQSNRLLNNSHYHLLLSLKNLALSVKTASTVWPPPDAAQKMATFAGQVLLSFRNFVSAAVESKIPLIKSSSSGSIDSSSGDSESDFQSITSDKQQLTDWDIIYSLDQYSGSIKSQIDQMLVNLDKKGVNQLEIVVETTQEIVLLVSAIVTTIEESQISSDLMSLVSVGEADDSVVQAVNEHKALSENLQHNISGLISAMTMASDPFSPPNAEQQVMLVTTVVLKSAKDVIVSTKRLVEKKQGLEEIYMERDMSQHITDSLDNALESGIEFRHSMKTERGDSGTATEPLKELQGTIRNKKAESEDYSRTEYLKSFASKLKDKELCSIRPINSAQSKDAKSSRFGLESSVATETVNSPASTSEPESRQKLKKFFGESIPRRRKHFDLHDENIAWYLTPDYKANELLFSYKGKDKSVKAGTTETFITRMTSHNEIDTDFVMKFFYTFRLFMEPSDLVFSLEKRFTVVPPQDLKNEEFMDWKEKKQKPIQLRVYQTFKRWLEEYWYEQKDFPALSNIVNFAKDKMAAVLSKEADRLIELCIKRKSLHENPSSYSKISLNAIVAEVHSSSPSSTVVLPKPSLKIKLLDIDPVDLARQLTLIESKLFLSIHPVDYLFYKPDSARIPIKTVNFTDLNYRVRMMINQSNEITTWVAFSILQEKDLKRRGLILKHFIKIAEKCHLLQNYATRESIIAALNSTPIYRLKKTWDSLNFRIKSTFDTLVKFMDRENNFVTYRQTLKTTVAPCVPFSGLYLTDITFIKQGNPDFLVGGKLINFDKYDKLAVLIDEIARFQSANYTFLVVEDIQVFVQQNLQNDVDVQRLHEMSESIEPRERTSFIAI